MEISAGGYHSLARKADGTVWGWGENEFGQLGNGVTTVVSPNGMSNLATGYATQALTSSGPLTGVTRIAAGWSHSLVLKTASSGGGVEVWGFGLNGDGQLGNNEVSNTSVAKKSWGSAGLQITSLAAGTHIGVVARADQTIDTVFSWGVNIANHLGTGKLHGHCNPAHTNGECVKVPTQAVFVPSLAPTGVTAVAQSGSATVSWVAPPATPVDKYVVTASPGGMSAESAALSKVVTGLTPGTSYTFTVKAVNKAGEGPASIASNAVIPKPNAPTAIAAISGDRSATVTWSAPTTEGITSFSIRCPATSTSCAPVTAIAGSARSYVVTGLTNGLPYTFQVQAIAAGASSAWSASSNAVVPV